MSRRPPGSTKAKTAAAVAARSPWIVGERYDQLFLWAAWFVPLALWLVAVSVPYGLLVALAIFILLDCSHQVATLPLTIFDPATMKRAAPVYLGGALAIGSAAIAISFYPDTLLSKIWASLVVYWGGWHIVRQHYGFLRLYQAREKPPDERIARAEVYALYSGAAFPYFMVLTHGWASEGIGGMLYRVPVPSGSEWVVLAIFVVSLAIALSDVPTRLRARKRVVSRRLLHVLLVVSNFWIGLMVAGRHDLILAVLFITSYHDLQYHAVVWHVGRTRVATEGEPVYSPVRRMFGSVGLFAAAVLVGALLQAFLRNEMQLAGSLVPQSAATAAFFALVTSYSYMHYFFDGKMWKLSRDPRLRAELGLGGK